MQHIRLLLLSLILFLMAVFWGNPRPVLAQEPLPQQLSVETAALNARVGPGSNTPVVARLAAGDILLVKGRENGWWLVKLPNDELAWVIDNPAYVSPAGNAPAPPKNRNGVVPVALKPARPSAQRLYVVAPKLNVRVGPGPGYSVIAQLSQGDALPAIEQNAANGWWLIRLPNKQTGWVSGNFAHTRPFEYGQYTPLPLSAAGTIILQPHSGGPIYALDAADLKPGKTPNLRYIDTGVDPALSPDGKRLAYTVYNSAAPGTLPGETGALWVYNMQNGQKRAVMGGIYEPKAPSWSPDGKEIVLSYQHGGRQTVERRCYAPGKRIRIPENASIFDVWYGKDGTICFKLFPDTHWKLRKVNVETGAFEDLTSEQYSFAPAWDPANPWRIVFFTPYNGLLQLDLNRGEYFPFFTSAAHMFAPVFSPDGSKVAVTFWLHDHWEVYVIDAASGELTRLTTGHPYNQRTASSAAPAWSPDGKQLIFLTDRSGQWEPWIMNADGANPRPLLPPDVIAGLNFAYHGVHERLFAWR